MAGVNDPLDSIRQLISEIENGEILNFLKLLERADDLLAQYQNDKEKQEEIMLGREEIENRLANRLQQSLPKYNKLCEAKLSLQNQKDELMPKLKKLNGLAIIEETNKYEKEIEAAKKKLRDIDEYSGKASQTIDAFREKAGRLTSLPKDLCESLNHPGRDRKSVPSHRGDSIDRWYCRNCEKFLED
jgi:hypothetical protein